MKLCERCNRPLKSQKSMDAGMGPVCKKKQAEEEAQAEFERNQLTIDEVLNDGKIENAS
ncbi:DUF6011 domain-containing protein [Domibacillus tundrae]|uniref:DUF6011 domain-containing protein n=1 Tax=Domibacillus tundrae TaxID=1587527 RepID=UPI00155AA80A|nr:DUF6011 domain-containing protein [Domibacillus tundrae]